MSPLSRRVIARLAAAEGEHRRRAERAYRRGNLIDYARDQRQAELLADARGLIERMERERDEDDRA